MIHMLTTISAGIFLLLLPTGILGARGRNQHCRETADAFLTVSKMPKVAIVSDVNDDSLFECVLGERIRYDPEAKETAYLLMFKNGLEIVKNVTYEISAGVVPDIFFFTKDDEPGCDGLAFVPYSDQQNCSIVIIADHGKRCLLYVVQELKDNVPRHCQEQFGDICGVAIPKYTQDMCPDGEGDI